MSLDTAVTLILFNRPDLTRRVFEEISKAKPRKLFLIADGPRPNAAGEPEKCAAARAVVDQVDWDCEVFKNYSKVNLGCGHRVATGITWVFEHVEEAIILEDDCLPEPTFFQFCSELLEKYRDNERVMVVSGNNYSPRLKRTSDSYAFRQISGVSFWGWATWRRAWQYHDIKAKIWSDLSRSKWLENLQGCSEAARFWRIIFDRAYATAGNNGTWDYQWALAIWAQNGLVISPVNNLVSNIGCREDATHCKSEKNWRADFPTVAMQFPLRHPPSVKLNRRADLLRVRKDFRSRKRPLYRWLPPGLTTPLRKLLSFVTSK